MLKLPIIVSIVTRMGSMCLAQSNKCGHITKSPTAYTKGSELNLLSWVEHGSYAQRGAAGRMLVEMKDKSQKGVTERVRACQDIQVFKNMLTLALFDLSPSKYVKATRALLDDDDRDLRTKTEGTWVKTEEEVDGKIVDFYFDWGGEAALRLLKNGYYSRRAREILIQMAADYYPSHRADASSVLALFPGIPKFDLSAQPQTINEQPWKEQIKSIEAWFTRNEKRIYWDTKLRQYRLRP